jgi:hypothetical protein
MDGLIVSRDQYFELMGEINALKMTPEAIGQWNGS